MTEKEAEDLTDRAFDGRSIGTECRRFFVRFGVSKQNYATAQVDRWYMQQSGGVLLPVELLDAKQDCGKGKHRAQA